MPVINGTPSSDTFDSTADDDVYHGLEGNDFFYGGIAGGVDFLYGDDGDDVFLMSDPSVAIYGGTGFDVVNFNGNLAGSGVTLNFNGLLSAGSAAFGGRGISGVERLGPLNLTNQNDYVVIGSDYVFQTDVHAFDGDDIILGGPGTDFIRGGNGTDYLVGGASDDQIYGGAGNANTLQGGTGNDTYHVDAVGDSIVEFVNEGSDTIITSLNSYVLRSDVEELWFTGIGTKVGIGNALNNTIYGSSAYDELFGGAGNDMLSGSAINAQDKGPPNALIGGAGDDTYVIYTSGDSTIELAGEGRDSVNSYVLTHVLQANVEVLGFYAPGDAIGVGNSLDNIIFGNQGRDSFIGLDGNDRLSGGAVSANELIGGLGDDQYYSSASGDSIVELVNEGYDLVWIDVPVFVLPANVEAGYHQAVGTFTLTGNNDANGLGAGDNSGAGTIYGLGGDDSITGSMAGGNTLIGGIGNDSYSLGSPSDTIIELPDEGRDGISFRSNPAISSLAYTLPTNIETLIGPFNAIPFYGVGNESDNLIYSGSGNDTLVGLAGADSLGGNDGMDLLFGDDGDDSLQGDQGIDTLFGGAGNDNLFGGQGSDRLVGGSGADSFALLNLYSGIDTIDDFQTGSDRLRFSQSDLRPGGGFQLVSGTGTLTATSDSTTFFHHLESGQLGYDPDGTGPIAEMIIAILKDSAALTLSDFHFI